MKKIITFLGKFPKKTQYLYNEKIYTGEVFAQALHQILEYDEMLVFLTSEARESSWQVLEALNDERIKGVDIPIGRSDEEIWQIFSIVVSQVMPNDEVIFDITHGLRSMPFMVFLFAAYLKTVLNANIDGIFYGAFELGNSKEGIPAPVFNLSSFINMLDWITAGDQFIRTGDAHWLAELMKTQNKSLGQIPIYLEKLSWANAFCNPYGIIENGYNLNQTAKRIKERDRDFSGFEPFWAIQPVISQELNQFVLDPQQQRQEKDVIVSEIHIIHSYIRHHQFIQATLLMRETLLDMVSFQLGQPLDYKRKFRSIIERSVSGLSRIGNRVFDEESGEYIEFTASDLNEFGRKIYDEWNEADQIRKIWDALFVIRNSFAHASHQSQKINLKDAEKIILEILDDFNNLAVDWGLLSVEEEL